MRLKPPIHETPAAAISDQFTSSVIPENVTITQDAIDEILNSSGIIQQIDAKDPNSIFKKHLSDKGGKLEDVAQQVVNLMTRGDSEVTRLSAAKFIAEIQGVQTQLENKPQEVKPINITIIGTGNNTMFNLMRPKG